MVQERERERERETSKRESNASIVVCFFPPLSLHDGIIIIIIIIIGEEEEYDDDAADRRKRSIGRRRVRIVPSRIRSDRVE